MPYKVVLDQIPAGIALESAREGDSLLVRCRGFLSTEDGWKLIEALESFADAFLPQSGMNSIAPSQVDHLLAVIQRDRTATVYVNELSRIWNVRTRKATMRGQRVCDSDIVDMGSLRFRDISIPADAGVFFLFSIGWRKGLFFDFEPLHGSKSKGRSFDLDALLGSLFGYVLFQERMAVTDEEWKEAFNQQWFLFSGLSNRTINRIIVHLRSGWLIDDLLNDIVKEVRDHELKGFVEAWKRNAAFGQHIKLLQRAADRFRDEDYISATAILYPRIEGIIRTSHGSDGAGRNATQKNMAQSAIGTYGNRAYSLLLPLQFRKYLEDVYFANFKSDDSRIAPSRHSVSHGVASQDAFSEKAAVIGILIVQQLHYFLSGTQERGTDS